MSATHRLSPPTSSLPSLRVSASLSVDELKSALHKLKRIYCPFPKLQDFHYMHDGILDSGYASEMDDGDDDGDGDGDGFGLTHLEAVEALRADAYESAFATRWLTSLVARAESLLPLVGSEVRERLVDEACAILAALGDQAGVINDESEGVERHFSFSVPTSDGIEVVDITLHDRPIQTGADHTDVGLQTWGASIVLAHLICAAPTRFLGQDLHARALRVVELGAGTGLISLVLAKLVSILDPRPRAAKDAPTVIIATDFHPVVLDNLRVNAVANMNTPADDAAAGLELISCLLDWSVDPSAGGGYEAPLDTPADVLIAADVVYEREHALWLRDCAARLLAPAGVFWLMASLRPSGRFAGLERTIDEVFRRDDGPRSPGRSLGVVHVEAVDKPRAVGRADECGYKLFEIRWV